MHAKFSGQNPYNLWNLTDRQDDKIPRFHVISSLSQPDYLNNSIKFMLKVRLLGLLACLWSSSCSKKLTRSILIKAFVMINDLSLT